MLTAVWLQLTGRRCRARAQLDTTEPADAPRLRCVLRRGHDMHGRTAFERMHGAPIGFGWRHWQ